MLKTSNDRTNDTRSVSFVCLPSDISICHRESPRNTPRPERPSSDNSAGRKLLNAASGSENRFFPLPLVQICCDPATPLLFPVLTCAVGIAPVPYPKITVPPKV